MKTVTKIYMNVGLYKQWNSISTVETREGMGSLTARMNALLAAKGAFLLVTTLDNNQAAINVNHVVDIRTVEVNDEANRCR